MSKVTKCDVCGAIDDGRRFDFGNKYSVPVKKHGFFGYGIEYVDVDVCVDCLKLLREKAEEVQKND